MSLVIANIPATFPSCKLGQNQMHCLDLHCPMGHASLIVSTAFARNREKTHPIFCCKEKPFPQNPQTQKSAGHGVSPLALWGVPMLWGDI